MNKNNECRYCLHALKDKPIYCPKCGSLLINRTVKPLDEGIKALGIIIVILAVVLFSEFTGLSLALFWLGGMVLSDNLNV